MLDEPASKNCGCGRADQTSARRQMANEVVAKVVKARVPQDHEANFNIRLVPARSLEKGLTLQPRCKPRGNVSGWGHGTVALDPGLVAALSKADKLMVAWLAKDTANTQRFLSNPVDALREAGVQLTRAQEKALARANEATSAARVVGPGINIASLSVRAVPNGRVGGIGSSKTDGKSDDFTCGPKRKG